MFNFIINIIILFVLIYAASNIALKTLKFTNSAININALNESFIFNVLDLLIFMVIIFGFIPVEVFIYIVFGIQFPDIVLFGLIIPFRYVFTTPIIAFIGTFLVGYVMTALQKSKYTN